MNDRRVALEVAEAAADWFTRLQEEDASEQDFQEWQRWLSAAPEHGRAYREIEQAWRLIGEVKPVPWAVDKRPARVLWALAASVLLLAGAGIWIYGPSSGRETYTTRIAEQRSIRLSDGSRITLGAKSEVTPAFDDGLRQVVLEQGEAFFEVARDPRRPFTVRAGSAEIRAVGTAFNVRAAADRVWVSVTEGKVVVLAQAGAAPQLIDVGEQAAITRRGVTEKKRSEGSAVTWLQGRFEYRGEELRHVVEDLNRYTERRIVLTDESVGNLRYSGTVFPDHLEEWLEGVGGALPVRVIEKDGRREISRAP